MIDLDTLIRGADPARDLVIPDPEPVDADRLSRRAACSPRRIAGAFGVAIGVAVAVAVAAIALIAGGDRRAGTNPTTRVTPAERPLFSILGVLRRPQTAADRAAALELAEQRARPLIVLERRAHGAPAGERERLLARVRELRAETAPDPLARLAAVTPWGERVILVPYAAGNSERLCVDSIFGGRVGSGSGDCGLTPALIEAGDAWSLEGAGRTFAGGSTAVRLFMVVPDGVAKVAFVLARGSSVPGGPVYTHSLSVLAPVHNNVAFAQINRYCCEGSFVTRWYAPDGRLLKTTGPPASGNRVASTPTPAPETALSRAAERNPSTPNPVYASPGSGLPTSTFKIQWRVLLSDADYRISATGPNGARCRGADQLSTIVGGGVNDVRGQLFGVTLPGGHGSNGWCLGTYRVAVALYDLGLAGGLKHPDRPFGTAVFTISAEHDRRG